MGGGGKHGTRIQHAGSMLGMTGQGKRKQT